MGHPKPLLKSKRQIKKNRQNKNRIKKISFDYSLQIQIFSRHAMRGEISNHKVVQGVQTSFGHEFSKIAQKTKKGKINS